MKNNIKRSKGFVPLIPLIVVSGLLVSTFLIGQKIYTNNEVNKNLSTNETSPILETTPTPNTPTPTEIFTPEPTETPVSENFNYLEEIDNSIRECSCPNGEVREITESECLKLICCNVSGRLELMTSEECDSKYNEKYQKEKEEYGKVQESLQKLQQLQDNLEAKTQEIREANLEACRQQAQEQYKQLPIGSSTGNGYGYVVGESEELRQKLKSALQKCNSLYGE